MLPNQERYVKRDAFEVYERRRRREENLVEEEAEEEELLLAEGGTSRSAKSKDVKNEIELARLAGHRHVRKIRQHILSQFKFVLAVQVCAEPEEAG